MRNFLYLLARLLGDIEAISKGKAGKRVARRMTGRMMGRILWQEKGQAIRNRPKRA